MIQSISKMLSGKQLRLVGNSLLKNGEYVIVIYLLNTGPWRMHGAMLKICLDETFRLGIPHSICQQVFGEDYILIICGMNSLGVDRLQPQFNT